MSVPAGIDADRGPPMVVPLVHFVVGFVFLLAGAGLGLASALGFSAGLVSVAHVHLLLVGWVAVTIMGAMTQFVPVWSGTDLHSRRLSVVQIELVGVGLAGFVLALLAGRLGWLPVLAGLMLVGFWVFAYNVTRTLLRKGSGDASLVASLDVTERHFALAVSYLLVVTVFGFGLALDFGWPYLSDLGLVRWRVIESHATLAVFGVVLTTVVGALYQLLVMFTQTEFHGLDDSLQRVEEWGYPVGVVALATGRLVGAEWLALVGGLLVVAGLLALAVVLVRKLRESNVEWTPMLSRYAVVAVVLPAWGLAAVPAWFSHPVADATTFGSADVGALLLAGVVGFVLLGTLYHVVPFIVWVRQYSDLVGLEPVPMIDDLYDQRLAAVDFWLTLGGLGLLLVGELAEARLATLAGGAAVSLGFVVFSANLVGVVARHGPESLRIGFLDASEEPDPDPGAD